jgi:hypothetical protein
MGKKTKQQQRLEENINFLKFDLTNGLALIRGQVRSGKVFDADKTLEELQTKFGQLFPFRYGSEMDTKGYSDGKVLKGED